MKILKLLVAFILILSCQNESALEKPDIIISLDKSKGSGPFPVTLNPSYLLDSIPAGLSGIPNMDSLKLVKHYFFRSKGDDSVKNYFYSISGFNDGTQYVISDTNNNNDFSDDTVQKYNNEIRYQTPRSLEARKEVPIYKINGQTKIDSNSVRQDFYMRVMPYYGYFNPIKDSISETYKLVNEINEHWYGEFEFNKESYKVAVNKNSMRGEKILIQKKSDSFVDFKRNIFYPYLVKDTIWVGDKVFKIGFDDYSNLRLKALEGVTDTYGHRIGDSFDSISYIDLIKDNLSNTDEILKDKDYLLLDFWGTWCKPCLQLTPKLKEIDSVYGANVGIFSIAYEEEREKAKDYILKKDLSWSHTFLRGSPKKREEHPELINNLRISVYPTFILVNKEKEIIYRGVGAKALENITSLLSQD